MRHQAPNQTCLQRRAGVRAPGGNSGYGQPKGGQKGGLFPSIMIKTLILNIIVMDYGAPTRTPALEDQLKSIPACRFPQ